MWVVSSNIFMRVHKSVASEVLEEGRAALSLDATEAAIRLLDPAASTEGEGKLHAA